ncbi:hypothetical protein ACQ4PT_021834 [Festuca glaucescens]
MFAARLGFIPEFSKDSPPNPAIKSPRSPSPSPYYCAETCDDTRPNPAVPRDENTPKALQSMAAAPNSAVVESRSRRAKRARAEVADPPDALSGMPAAHTSNWRDWANLTDGPAGLIAEEVLADDVAGFLRFRAACSSWRRRTPSPNVHDGLDSRFHPRRWIMLPEVFAGQISRRDFLNVSTGERIRVDPPKLRHQFVIGPTAEGLILLCQKRTGRVYLLNPLTQQLTALPNMTSLLYSLNSHRWKSGTGLRKLKELKGFSAGLADSSTIALHFDDHERELAVAKPNDKRWSRRVRPYSLMASLNPITTTLSFANRFYCFTRSGIKVVDVTDAGQRPQLAAVKVDEHFWSQDEDVSLVDNDGELILLRPSGRRIIEPYDVHRVDLDAGQMVPMHGLRGRAVFVCNSGAGRGRSLSVHTGLSSSITADAIYRCHSDSCGRNDGRPKIDVFLVPDDRWIERDLLVSPGSIIDYLSRVRAAADGPRKQMKRERKANRKVIGNEWVN